MRRPSKLADRRALRLVADLTRDMLAKYRALDPETRAALDVALRRQLDKSLSDHIADLVFFAKVTDRWRSKPGRRKRA